jgi:hypothetical protein
VALTQHPEKLAEPGAEGFAQTNAQKNGQPPASTPTDASVEAAAIRLVDDASAGRLLLSDIRTSFLIANEARHRIISRLFGIPREQENLLTLVAALMMAEAIRERFHRLQETPPLPSFGDGMLEAMSINEALCTVAGPASRQTPMMGALIALALVGHGLRPTVAKALHDLRSSAQFGAVHFHHRYGYLVDPGHWRRRRAMNRGERPR